MGQQKSTFSLRMRQELKSAIEETFWSREAQYRRLESPSAFAEQLMECIWLQYETAGSLEKLLRFQDLILKSLKQGIANQGGDMVSSPITEKQILERQVRTGGQVNEQEAGTAPVSKTKSHRSKSA